jgi:hypothetical protein
MYLSTFLAKLKSTTRNRQFFEEFAKTGGFDPLLPSNWYQFAGSILASKVACLLDIPNLTNFFRKQGIL